MKIKTSELEGKVLNWAVRYALDNRRPLDYVENRDNFSTCWNKGGPIGDLARINVRLIDDNPDVWAASLGDPWRMLPSVYSVTGHSRLVAMMRCFVMSKLGEEVDAPEELTKSTARRISFR